MSIIEDIKQARMNLLTIEQKKRILANIKAQLLKKDYALVKGAAHYGKWDFPDKEREMRGFACEAPYSMHPAISEYLHSLGFHTRRHYIGSVRVTDYAMEVFI